MRRLSALIVGLLVAACTGGASPNGSAGTSSSPSSPAAGTSSVCSAYIACVATKAPEMLDPVTAAYGKAGSCYDEMSVAECEDACAAGQTKMRCGQCDLGSASCLGEACGAQKRCPVGEVCAKGTCIEEVRKTCDSDADCAAPWSCHGIGDGFACVLPCVSVDDCPAGQRCAEEEGICYQ